MNKNINLLLLSLFLSQFGSHLTGFALSIWIYQSSGSLVSFGLMAVVYSLPRLLFTNISGIWVDKFSRKKLLYICNAIYGSVILGLWILNTNAMISPFVVIVALFLLGMVETTLHIANISSVSLFVADDAKLKVNGIVQLSFSVIQILSPLFAGWMYYLFGLGTIFLFDILALIGALAAIWMITFPKPPETKTEQIKTSINDFWFGYKYMYQHKQLFQLVLFSTTVAAALALIEMLLTPLILTFSHPGVLGNILMLGGFGMMLGGILTLLINKKTINSKKGFLVQLIIGLLLVCLPFQSNLFGFTTILFFTFMLSTVMSAIFQTLWQVRVPIEVQGKVFASRLTIQAILVTSSYILIPVIVEYLIEPIISLIPISLGVIFVTVEAQSIAIIFLIIGIFSIFPSLIGFSKEGIHIENDDSNQKVFVFNPVYTDINENKLNQYLSADELKRANSFKFKRLQINFKHRRVKVKKILSRELNLPIKEINFIYNQQGKPLLENQTRPKHFNYSITQTHCAMVHDDKAIGVDIEEIKPIENLSGFVKLLMHNNELNVFKSLSKDLALHYVYKIWVIKEALIKSIGLGMSIDITSIDLTLNWHKKTYNFNKEIFSHPLNYCLTQYDENHYLSVAYQGKPRNIELLRETNEI